MVNYESVLILLLYISVDWKEKDFGNKSIANKTKLFYSQPENVALMCLHNATYSSSLAKKQNVLI